MSLRVTNLRLALDEPEAVLPDRVCRALGIAPGSLSRWRILRKSLDARDRDHFQFVYTLEVDAPEDEPRLLRGRSGAPADVRVERYTDQAFQTPDPGSRPLKQRPVVVGSVP